MGDIIYFESRKNAYKMGCKGCIYLQEISKGNFICSDRHYIDGSTIYPITNGKRTGDYGACKGDGYEKKPKKQTSTYYEAGKKPVARIINIASSDK